MKGIKDWANDMENNEQFMKRFEGLESYEDIIRLAKKEGYDFTEDEFMDLQMEMVSGGGKFGSKLKNFFKKAVGTYCRVNGTIHEKMGGITEKLGDLF